MRSNYMKRPILRVIVLFAMALGWQAYADPVLTLTPGDDISGAPGSTIGWGYQIDNDTGFYLLPSGSFFCEPGEDPLFTTCAPNLGASTYTDYITINAFLTPASIPPGDSSASFDSVTQTGFGAYNIDPAASPGSQDTGFLVLEYTEWNFDPLVDSSAIQENTSGGEQSNGVFELTSDQVTVTVTPEPAAAGLFVCVLAGFAIVTLRRRAS